MSRNCQRSPLGSRDMSDAEHAPAMAADADAPDAASADAVAADTGAGDAVTGDVVTVHRSLSPSRAADFMTCPLLYRFRVVDRLPEPPSAAAARGTLVHAVLERLFDEPAAGRTPAVARALLQAQWRRLRAYAAEPPIRI